MYRFWDTIIEPVLQHLKPSSIVEIGSDQGKNTRNLLDFCKRHGATLYAIDPLPKFDVAAWQEQYGEQFVFYQSLSLNAIPKIDRFDVVLIDGDHNWYTVFNELQLIEKCSEEIGQSFPLIMLHDIGWPYARRDLYYNPDTIPEAYRKPYTKKGIRPGITELQEKDGFNSHLFNSIYENNLQNGVLTAIEDFIKESKQVLELIKLPGFHGFGILFLSKLKEQNPELTSFLNTLVLPLVIERYIEKIEQIRIETEIVRETNRNILRAKETQVIAQQVELEHLLGHIKETQVAEQKEELERLQDALRDKEIQVAEQKEELERLQDALRDKEIQVAEQKEELERLQDAFQKMITTLRDKETQIAELDRNFKDAERMIIEKNNQIYMLDNNLHQCRQNMEKLESWINKLNKGVSSLLDSRRWKIGNALGELQRKILLKGYKPTEIGYIKDIIQEFMAWKKDIARNRNLVNKKSEDNIKKNNAQILKYGENVKMKDVKCIDSISKRKFTIAIIAWDVGHNPLGRAYLLAEALQRKFNVILLGFSFDRFGNNVWEPLKEGRIPIVNIKGDNFPEFAKLLEMVAGRIDVDVIIACKPRLPSVQLGLMIKMIKNRPLFIDIDDYELSFFKERSSLSLEQVNQLLDKDDIAHPFGETWTRFAEKLLPLADGILVSNHKLKEKYGGAIIPHARDEEHFNPELYDRLSSRRELGIQDTDKVILFAGTPRPHKGLLQLLDAVKRCNNNSYKVCIVGSPPDNKFQEQLKDAGGKHLIMLPNQPFDKLPYYLVAADVVCILQDPESEISQYQLPAKVVDALAMSIPIVATHVPPLRSLIDAGVIIPANFDNLHSVLNSVLNTPSVQLYREKQREIFLSDYSYNAILSKLEKLIEDALDKPKPLKTGMLNDLIEVQRQVNLNIEKSTNNILEDNKGKFDIVMFWKQNDTGLYGRRSDMMIKYLAQRPEVKRIVVFDLPMSQKELFNKSKPKKITHDRYIFIETLARSWGLRNNKKVTYHTFIYKSTDNFKRNHIAFVGERLKEVGIDPKESIFWIYPKNYYVTDIIDYFRPGHMVVDVVDDHRAWPRQSSNEINKLTTHYKKLISKADLVMANCETVKSAMQQFKTDIKLVPNACELEPPPQILDNKTLQWVKGLPGPKIGYVGNLEVKIDIELLRYLAINNPEWQIILIGSTHSNPKILELKELPNIYFLGVIRYPEVKAYINEFDVGIIPHLDIELTRSMNPLKAFVYLTLGIPVVATKIANLGEAEQFIHVADSKESFSYWVKECIKKGRQPVSEELKAFLEKNSWPCRVDFIIQCLENLDNDCEVGQNKKILLSLKNKETNEDENKNLSSQILISPAVFKRDWYEGICTVCGRHSVFEWQGGSIRESYRCYNCGASLRYREQAGLIIRLYGESDTLSLSQLIHQPKFKQLFIYEPGIAGPFRKYFNKLPYYQQSYYWEDLKPGNKRDNIECQDLQALTYSDNSFDLVITSDILEHIRKPYNAFAEIRRVLKPGGVHIFTVPLVHPMPNCTRYRVDTSTSEDIHILPPRYHNSPYEGKALVYTDFGADMLERLRSMGFPTQAVQMNTNNPNLQRLLTFVSTKS